MTAVETDSQAAPGSRELWVKEGTTLRPRRVYAGAASGDMTEITEGLTGSEEIVTGLVTAKPREETAPSSAAPSCRDLREATTRKNSETTMKEVIRLDNIRRDFVVGDEVVHALRGISLTITEGEFVTIMGTSGSGKSTLLNTLGCLDTPTSGEYYLDGIAVRSMDKTPVPHCATARSVSSSRTTICWPKTTALENVELPLMYNSTYSAAQRRERAEQALRNVGLGDRMLHKSNQMSGGQMQRVAIARALVNDPAVILADERRATSTPAPASKCWCSSSSSTPRAARSSS